VGRSEKLDEWGSAGCAVHANGKGLFPLCVKAGWLRSRGRGQDLMLTSLFDFEVRLFSVGSTGR